MKPRSKDCSLPLLQYYLGTLILLLAVTHLQAWPTNFFRGYGRNIRPIHCVSDSGDAGVCMFAWDCMKANGTHLGTCIERFYFGSCCKMNSVKRPSSEAEADIDLTGELTENVYDTPPMQDPADPEIEEESGTMLEEVGSNVNLFGSSDDKVNEIRPIKVEEEKLSSNISSTQEESDGEEVTGVMLNNGTSDVDAPVNMNKDVVFDPTKPESQIDIDSPSVDSVTELGQDFADETSIEAEPSEGTDKNATDLMPETQFNQDSDLEIGSTNYVGSSTTKTSLMTDPTPETNDTLGTDQILNIEKPTDVDSTSVMESETDVTSSIYDSDTVTEFIDHILSTNSFLKPMLPNNTLESADHVTPGSDTSQNLAVTESEDHQTIASNMETTEEYSSSLDTEDVFYDETFKPFGLEPVEVNRPDENNQIESDSTVPTVNEVNEITAEEEIKNLETTTMFTEISEDGDGVEDMEDAILDVSEDESEFTTVESELSEDQTTIFPKIVLKNDTFEGQMTLEKPETTEPSVSTESPQEESIEQTQQSTSEVVPIEGGHDAFINGTTSETPDEASTTSPSVEVTDIKDSPAEEETSSTSAPSPASSTIESISNISISTSEIVSTTRPITSTSIKPSTVEATSEEVSNSWDEVEIITETPMTTSRTVAPTNSSQIPIIFPVNISKVTEIVETTTATSSVSPMSPEELEVALEEMLATASYKDVCGQPVYPTSRIVGGLEAFYGEWPWQVSLRQWRSVAFLHKCGAALVNENWAITAAHCVEGIEPDQLLLVMGEYDLGTTKERHGHVERSVQVIAMHPDFEPRTFEYDLALLRFSEPVTFQPNIIPICIPDDDYNFLNKTGFVTGWGRLYEDGPLPTVMQKVPVPVIPNEACESMYKEAGYIEHIPNIFICAGYQSGKQDSCEGDSGGPMVIRYKNRWRLAGIISWGIGCAVENQPGVYTRISEFREWINKIIIF